MLLPIRADQAGLGDLVDVALKRERHDVGLKSVDDGAGLLARSAMRLLDGDIVSAFRFPVLDEGGIHVLVEFTGRVVRDIEKGGVGEHGARAKRKAERGSGRKGVSQYRHRILSSV